MLWKIGEIAPLFHNIFYISLISGVKLHIICKMWLFDLFFPQPCKSDILEVLMSRSISESPLDFEITGVDCIYNCCFDITSI